MRKQHLRPKNQLFSHLAVGTTLGRTRLMRDLDTGMPARNPRGPTGFTLFEVVVVLVIIALVLGMTFRGTSAVRDGYTKDLAQTARDLSSAAAQFKDRYHYLPGDIPEAFRDITDIAPTDECSNSSVQAPKATTGAGAGNGKIEVNNSDALRPDIEVYCAPLHLHFAGLIRDRTSPLIKNYGDSQPTIRLIALADSHFSSAATYPRVVNNIIEVADVPLDISQGVDRALDDGDLRTGKVRGCDTSGNLLDPNNLPTVVPFLAVPLL